MDRRQVINGLSDLLENASELGDERYIDLFKAAIDFVDEGQMYKNITEVLQEKLFENMSEEERVTACIQIAKESFSREVDQMDDGTFKDFCIENMDRITRIEGLED